MYIYIELWYSSLEAALSNLFYRPVVGGMQDWNYLHTNCFEVTIELGCVKYPKAEELPKYWEQNRRSLLQFMKQVRHFDPKHLHELPLGFALDLPDLPICGLKSPGQTGACSTEIIPIRMGLGSPLLLNVPGTCMETAAQ